MRYMLLIYTDEKLLTEPERAACYKESTELAHEMQAKGAAQIPMARRGTVEVRPLIELPDLPNS